jgi:putative ABC transport system permease protein
MDDVLGFEVGGARIEARITSLRRLEWDSMRVNFFVVTPPGVLDGFPVSYITSFHLPAGKDGFVNELVGAFPNITVVDVAAVLRQFQAVMDQLAGAVQFVFVFALIAGMVVLFAALESTHDERGYEIAVMRTLGARDSQLRAALIAEFSVLGAVAGALGGGGAAVIGWVLAAHVFKLPYQPGMSMPVLGLVVGAAAVVAAGLLGTASILRQPAVRSLRAMA